MGRRRIVVAALALSCSLAACSNGSAEQTSEPSATPPAAAASTPTTSTTPTPLTTSTAVPRSPSTSAKPSTSAEPATSAPTAHAASSTGGLPLRFGTGRARQVITVIAPSGSSTTGTLQAWQRAGSGWTRVGPSVHAYLGSDGIGQASESTSATPTGSYTLTRAFGRDADPGSGLPYTRTTPDDWWISQPGPLYNTRQRCASSCRFTQGSPNEHLYYETPFYEYALVIDYNTGNAPGGVQPGAGSAFFLHVTVHQPTQGCVSIERDQLVRILRWLRPGRHPRILLGTT